jgi:acyl-CoA synthetase (AMP-forming)/AMP-acid ligase II
MNMAAAEAASLRDALADGPKPRFLWDRAASVRFTDLDRGTSLGGQLAALHGRSVLIATASQLTTALAFIELEGRARRVLVLPPDVAAEHVAALVATAAIDAVVTDADTSSNAIPSFPISAVCAPSIMPANEIGARRARTEWLLMTSGTTGIPKLVKHDLVGLTTALRVPSPADGATVWGTFYDIRRYGGLQIFLRAVLGGASLVLSSAGEPVGDHLARLAQHGVTHLSGTPSQWRRALMSPAIRAIAPRYVRLSGEIADQAVLDALRVAFPQATIGHAYASTEAGVGFDVNDGQAGFPAAYVASGRGGVEMKVVDDTLRIRSQGAAAAYVGTAQSLTDTDGFVDTGDIVELRDGRYHFAGRRGGVINIGGLKVHPEEIEAVINRHPRVRMSLVRPKQNPLTGSIVVADIVLNTEQEMPEARQFALKDDILQFCREALPRHKVPAAISFVAALNVAATGKLRRQG